jgi:hypothetical protein
MVQGAAATAAAMTAATLLANGVDMCAIAAGVLVVTVRLVLEPLRS